MFQKSHLKSLFLTSVLWLSFSCSHSKNGMGEVKEQSYPQFAQIKKVFMEPEKTPPYQRGQLISQELVTTFSQEAIQKRYHSRTFRAKYGVEVYRIVYLTPAPNGEGRLIKASGIVVYPQNDDRNDLPWLSLQHGTITGDMEAPSEDSGYGLAEGSQGFVTAVQDYIGFGASNEYFHPYMVAQTYVESGIDMLRAVRSFVQGKDKNVTALFLRGYSEGGYATMALQKAIEEKFSEEFFLKASAPAAGPYDLVITSKVLGAQEKASPVNLPFVVLSYDHWFKQESPLWDISRVVRQNPKDLYQMFDGSLSSKQISEQLPHETKELFYESFVQDVILDVPQTTEGKQMRSWLQQETLTNKGWSPKVPTRLYHCMDDTVVPVDAAQSAWNSFKEIDPAAPVEAILIESPDMDAPYDHGNCPVFFSSLTWLVSFL